MQLSTVADIIWCRKYQFEKGIYQKEIPSGLVSRCSMKSIFVMTVQ